MRAAGLAEVSRKLGAAFGRRGGSTDAGRHRDGGADGGTGTDRLESEAGGPDTVTNIGRAGDKLVVGPHGLIPQSLLSRDA
eukprot:278375-Chlamydomonas_euryale.AAC.2